MKLTTSHIRINYHPNYFSLTDEKVSNRRGFVAGTRDYLSPEIFSVQLTSSDDVMVEETKEKNLTELTGKVRIGFLFTKIYFCDTLCSILWEIPDTKILYLIEKYFE